MKRRSGLNFSRRRKKFNVPLFKEIMTWVLECAIVIAIAYALVSSFGFRTTVVGNAMQDTLQSEEQILSIALSIWYARQSRAMSSFFCRMEMKNPIIMSGGLLPVRGYGTDQKWESIY